MGIPIPKPLVIWASPSHNTLAIWVRVRVRVRVTEDAISQGVLTIRMPKHGDVHTTVTAALNEILHICERR